MTESILDDLLPPEAVVLTQSRTVEEPFVIRALPTAKVLTRAIIKSLPTYGTLTATSLANKSLPLNFTFTMASGDKAIVLSYEPNHSSYFSVPRSRSLTAANYKSDSFIYLVDVRTEVTNELIASRMMTQRIDVRNVNHAPILTVPNQAFNLSPPAFIHDAPFAVVNGIHVDDADNNVNKIRVDLSAENGTLSMNDKWRSLANFDCSSVQGWQCHGDGLQDRYMTFLSDPSHVSFILNDLRYTSFNISNNDVIVVKVFDGIGRDCLGYDEQTFGVGVDGKLYSSIQTTCFAVHGEIRINSPLEPVEGCFWELDCWDWRFVGIIVGYNIAGVVGFCVVGCYFIKLLEWCCGRARGRDVTQDDEIISEAKRSKVVEVPVSGPILVTSADDVEMKVEEGRPSLDDVDDYDYREELSRACSDTNEEKNMDLDEGSDQTVDLDRDTDEDMEEEIAREEK